MNVRFFDKAVDAGRGEDGMPVYRLRTMVEVARSPNHRLVRRAEPEDRRRWPRAHAAYEALRDPAIDGFPVVAWPGIDEAVRETLKCRGILTLEALAATDVTQAPVEVREAKTKAVTFLEALRSDAPKLAARIASLEAEGDRLRAEIGELKTELAGRPRRRAKGAAKASR